MALDELVGLWGREPTDEAALVLVDALLEAGDPRGQLAVDPSDEALQVCADRIVARAGEVSLLRFERGMCVEAVVSPAQAAALRPELVDGEPRLTLRIAGLPGRSSDAERWAAARAEIEAAFVGLSRFAGRGLFGLQIGRVEEELSAEVIALIEALAPRALWIDAGRLAPATTWPQLEALAATPGDDAEIGRWLEACPNLRALHLPAGGALPAALWRARPALEHLDLRGRDLSPGDRAALEAWLGGDTSRSVRHERFSLAAPRRDFGFNDGGLIWPPARDRRRVAIERGEGVGDRLSYAISSGSTVRVYRGDQPAEIIDARGEPDAISMEVGNIAFGYRGQRPVRRDGRTFDGGAIIDGTAVVIGERRVELGAPVLAVAGIGEGVAVIAGTRVWLIGRESVSMLGERDPGGRAVIAASGETAAWIQSPSAVGIARAPARSSDDWAVTSCVYPGTYSSGALKNPLRVADLDVSDAGVVVVALENGGANVLYPDRALKVDAFDGEPDGSWIFVYNGQILMAGDLF